MMEIAEKSLSANLNEILRTDLASAAFEKITSVYGHIDKNGRLSVNLSEILAEFEQVMRSTAFVKKREKLKKCRTNSICPAFYLFQEENGTFSPASSIGIFNFVKPYQYKPSITPSSVRFIPMAAGTLGRPGIVKTLPVNATKNPAPSFGTSSRT